jgi:hypothetical protein
VELEGFPWLVAGVRAPNPLPPSPTGAEGVIRALSFDSRQRPALQAAGTIDSRCVRSVLSRCPAYVGRPERPGRVSG